MAGQRWATENVDLVPQWELGWGQGWRLETEQGAVTHHKILVRRAGGPDQGKLGLRGADSLGEGWGGGKSYL